MADGGRIILVSSTMSIHSDVGAAIYADSKAASKLFVDVLAKELGTRQVTAPKYLSSLLRVLSGQNTQQYIHDKLIKKAKEKLSITTLSVSEIAYELGFEYL